MEAPRGTGFMPFLKIGPLLGILHFRFNPSKINSPGKFLFCQVLYNTYIIFISEFTSLVVFLNIIRYFH